MGERSEHHLQLQDKRGGCNDNHDEKRNNSEREGKGRKGKRKAIIQRWGLHITTCVYSHI